MRIGIRYLAIFLLLGAPATSIAHPSTQLKGYALSEWYAFEDASDTQHQQFYQTLSFRLSQLGTQPLSLIAHMRYQGDSADEFSSSSILRLHTLYLHWNGNPKLDLRLGRQFLAEGVGLGTYDALRLKIAPYRWGSVSFWAGLAAPYSRFLQLNQVESPDEAPAFGFAVRGRVASGCSVTGSYLREMRQGELFRHRAGIASNFALRSNLRGTALLYFNIGGASALHRLRVLLRYRPADNFRFFSEFAMGTPQLPPDSPFSTLEVEPTKLIRAGGSYQVYSRYWVGIRLQTLLTEGAPSTTLGLTLEGAWGLIGYRQRFGDFGAESGFWGSAQYSLTKFAQVYGSADFSVYKFEDFAADDQTALQAGMRLFLLRSLRCEASVQGLKNRQFDQDIRGVLRVRWSFGN